MTIENLKKVVLVLCAAVAVQVLFAAYLLVKWNRFMSEEEDCCECTAEVELPEEHFPFAGYYSADRKIAIEMPKWDASVTVDGKILYPVVVHYQEYDGDRIVTNMCCETDRGTCGNYKVETVDGGFSLTDSSWAIVETLMPSTLT